MPKRTIYISDLSEAEVQEGDEAYVRITEPDSDEVRTLIVTKEEARTILAGGNVTKKRGRKAADTDGASAAAPAAPAAAKAAK